MIPLTGRLRTPRGSRTRRSRTLLPAAVPAAVERLEVRVLPAVDLLADGTLVGSIGGSSSSSGGFGGSSEGGGGGGGSVGQDPDSSAGVRGLTLAGRSADGAWWVTAVENGFGHTSTFAAWDPSVDWRDVTAADFDGDSLDDLAGRDPATGAWFVTLSDGSGSTTLFADQWSTGVEWLDVGAADLAAPGDRGPQGHFTHKADLVGRTAGGQWWAAISAGDGTFRDALLTAWNPAAGWRDVRLLDANADGATDLLGRTAGGDWWVSLSRLGPGGEGLAYENVYLGGWNEAAGWRDVLVTNNFFGDGRDGLVARAADGGWWALRFGDGGAAWAVPLGAWSTEAEWNDVLAGDLSVAPAGSEFFGRDAAGVWWASFWDAGALRTRAIGTWNASAGWRDVRVAGAVDSFDGTSSGRQAIVGRASDGGLWMSRMTGYSIHDTATLGHSPIGSWAPNAGWRDVRAGDFIRQSVELRTEVRGGTTTRVIDFYAGRYGASASVSEGASSPWGREIQVAYSAGTAPRQGGFVGSRVSFGTAAGPGTAFAVRFRGHWGADLFRNNSSMPAEAYGRGGGDAFYTANGVADTLFGGDGLDVLVTGDPFDEFSQDG